MYDILKTLAKPQMSMLMIMKLWVLKYEGGYE